MQHVLKQPASSDTDSVSRRCFTTAATVITSLKTPGFPCRSAGGNRNDRGLHKSRYEPQRVAVWISCFTRHVQDNDATEPEGCARTRPWTHNNPLLRQIPWPDDENMDYTPPHDAAADSQTADVDITTPEIADIASRMDMRNIAAQALHLDQQNRGSSQTTLAPHPTDAILPHPGTVQRQQVMRRTFARTQLQAVP